MTHHHKQKNDPAESQRCNDCETNPEQEEVQVNTSPEPEENTVPEVDALAEAKRENEELQQKLLYLQADYQNYRKRTAKDIAEARMLGTSNALSPFLNVFDFLNMAGAAAEKSDNIESIRQGLKMIIGEFNKAFDELGVKKLSTVGGKFDPDLHDAVSHEPHDDIPEGQIVKEWSGGFKLGERLLRPARVVVSAGAKAPEETAEKGE